jgi:hypothetical protein
MAYYGENERGGRQHDPDRVSASLLPLARKIGFLLEPDR